MTLLPLVLAVASLYAAEAPKLKAELEALIAAAKGNRSAGSPGAARAREWIVKRAKALKGWKVEERAFSPDLDYGIRWHNQDYERVYEKPYPPGHPLRVRWGKIRDALVSQLEALRGKPAVNVILRKEGRDKSRPPLLVSAHYDTITMDKDTMLLTPEAPAPGADDNGAAVVALLELARRLDGLKPGRTVEFVFFDFEEAFFLGSKAYAEELQNKGIQVELVNLEMIGWDRPQRGKIKVYSRSIGSHPLAPRDRELAHKARLQLLKAGLKPLVLLNNFDRSDNWSFWNNAHVGVTISQDWESNFNREHYHSGSDTPDTVDWGFVGRIVTACERLARELSR